LDSEDVAWIVRRQRIRTYEWATLLLSFFVFLPECILWTPFALEDCVAPL
jgi:hypothetical protein